MKRTITVPGATDERGRLVPEIPEGIRYTRATRNRDGTYTLELAAEAPDRTARAVEERLEALLEAMEESAVPGIREVARQAREPGTRLDPEGER